MLGNNFGLFASAAKTKCLLRRFRTMTSSGATLIVGSLNVYETKDPDHLAYLAANRARGRMSGQIRMRARYRRFVTPWFDYLMVSPEEMDTLLEGTGWRVAKRYQGTGARTVTRRSSTASTERPRDVAQPAHAVDNPPTHLLTLRR